MSKAPLKRIAENPIVDGLLPHLRVHVNTEVPDLFFLPGDPGRLKLFAELADSFTILSENREFSIGIGSYRGKEFGVCSTGIGGGSTEIAMVELRELGVHKVIRVGGCGALDERIPCGEIIMNSGAIRLGGSSKTYAMPEYPAVADPFLLVALFKSALESGHTPFVGIGATVDSYYAGQGRPISVIANLVDPGWIQKMQSLRVINFDMETETIYTLASLMGMKAANILAVHGNRSTNLWLSDYRVMQLKTIKIALQTNFEERSF